MAEAERLPSLRKLGDAKEDYRRALSKEEVLEKLRKDEPVAREDLIRALGDKKQ